MNPRNDVDEDAQAFAWFAEPDFPWIRVTFGEAPDLPPLTWVYYLMANGKTRKQQAGKMPWYRQLIHHSTPPRARPIAYIIVDKDFTP